MILKYFKGSIISTLIGLPLCAWLGYYYNPTPAGALQALFIAAILAILEVSLSFDNAIVNAKILRGMTPVWRHRFLTWGMVIAVFGMRLVFPLLIVTVVAKIGPWSALVLASTQPDEYARIMLSAHSDVAAFGGSFLMMVAMKYFYDETKDHHWISWIEKPVAYLGRIEAVEMLIALTFLVIVTRFLPAGDQFSYLVSGLFGVITYLVVSGIGAFLEKWGMEKQDLSKASVGAFLYLEVLDASFSFDGVVGAFAITNNLFVIMVGLSIGAFFVRSLTILFVERETLQEFAYLEHGAFYAIGSLAVLMMLNPIIHIPEWITGLIGAVFIITAFVSSLRLNRISASEQPKAG